MQLKLSKIASLLRFPVRLIRALTSLPPVRYWKSSPQSRVFRPRIWTNLQHIKLGNRTQIRAHSALSPITEYESQIFQPDLRIGNDVYIGRYAFIACINLVSISDGTVLSDYVYINDSAHGLDPAAGPIMKQPLWSKGPISIGKNCFIGYGARIMPGVSLGDHCIVGTNAVVTKSFPAGSVLAGVPAKLIKTIELYAAK